MTETSKSPKLSGGKIHLLIFIHDLALAPFGAQRESLNTVKHFDKNCLERG